jgi:hypothetical protein
MTGRDITVLPPRFLNVLGSDTDGWAQIEVGLGQLEVQDPTCC